MLKIVDLQARVGETPILRGVTLAVGAGEVVALMGPNGSGKSTLAQVLMGHPGYTVEAGQVQFRGEDLLALKPEERARAGLFLSWQHPQEVPGVTLGHFLRMAYNATHELQLSVPDFLVRLKEKMQLLQLPDDFMMRSVNEGFSGGEKKRAEILQLAVLKPRLAILDEPDSGLDVDALKVVAQALGAVRVEQPELSILLITHYQRILQHLPVDRVAVMRNGKIVKEGAAEVITQIETEGYHRLT